MQTEYNYSSTLYFYSIQVGWYETFSVSVCICAYQWHAVVEQSSDLLQAGRHTTHQHTQQRPFVWHPTHTHANTIVFNTETNAQHPERSATTKRMQLTLNTVSLSIYLLLHIKGTIAKHVVPYQESSFCTIILISWPLWVHKCVFIILHSSDMVVYLQFR